MASVKYFKNKTNDKGNRYGKYNKFFAQMSIL